MASTGLEMRNMTGRRFVGVIDEIPCNNLILSVQLIQYGMVADVCCSISSEGNMFEKGSEIGVFGPFLRSPAGGAILLTNSLDDVCKGETEESKNKYIQIL